ncbi:MAG TPA: PEGA domain-containing protein [Clostridiales bacterium]|nr:PEGA domain-containing protein [Clostridiales bacterium]
MNRRKINIRPILSLLMGLSFLTVIFIITMVEASEGASKKSKKNLETSFGLESSSEEDSEKASEVDHTLVEKTAILKKIHISDHKVSLYDIHGQKELLLNFAGSSDIRDKYDQVILISQIPIGTIVDLGYNDINEKIAWMKTSTKAWEYIGVSNFTIQPLERIFEIADKKYRYSEDILIIDGKDFVPIENIKSQDVLTIWGIDDDIYSIIITKGHGTVRLVDYDAFLGGNITVGYESLQQITDDLVITVREGNFNLTVENGNFSATKNITISRNQETLVSLKDLGPEAIPTSQVTFEISPFGADLYIDDELTNYGNPIELSYGTHKIKVSLGGYTTFQGNLMVDEAKKTIRVNLPETDSNKDVDVSVDNELADLDDQGADQNQDWIDLSEYESETEKDKPSDNIIDEEHYIYVQNPIGASVYLDGEFLGISPGNFRKVIGTHVLTLIKDGYETKSYTIEVVDDGQDAYFSLSDLIPLNEN